MDDYLIKYLNSGKAWVLVGSGPSTQAGYPTWSELAQRTIEEIKREAKTDIISKLEYAYIKKDFPLVFEYAQSILGAQQLMSFLKNQLVNRAEGDVYKLIAKWPVNVYLTTNYDDQLQTALTQVGVSYQTFLNSQDEMSHLDLGVSNLILKLHGDFRTETGLILTSTQYRDIAEAESWAYWRQKMLGIFQLIPLIIVGHSLTDPHIKHLLHLAKKGSNVTQPICWIAPEVPDRDSRELLEMFRIRVTSYSNKNGSHQDLLRLLQNLDNFIPSRVAVKMKLGLDSNDDNKSSAAGFFVFGKLSQRENIYDKQLEVILAAIQAALPTLSKRHDFTLREALQVSGWRSDISAISEILLDKVEQLVLKKGFFVKSGVRFLVNPNYKESSTQKEFEHIRDQFISVRRYAVEGRTSQGWAK